MLGGHRYFGIRDIMYLLCYMISQDQGIKGSWKFNGRSRYSHEPKKFGSHRHCGNGNISFSSSRDPTRLIKE